MDAPKFCLSLACVLSCNLLFANSTRWESSGVNASWATPSNWFTGILPNGTDTSLTYLIDVGPGNFSTYFANSGLSFTIASIYVDTPNLGGAVFHIGGDAASASYVPMSSTSSGVIVNAAVDTADSVQLSFLRLNGPSTLSLQNKAQVIYDHIIGPGGLTVSGQLPAIPNPSTVTETLFLAGPNDYGTTKVSNATIVCDTENAFPQGSSQSGQVSLIASVLDLGILTPGSTWNIAIPSLVTDANSYVINDESAAGKATLTVGGDNASTEMAGQIGPASLSELANIALTKLGTGTLTLSGTNGYTGGTTLAAGTLAVMNGSSLGTGAVTFNGSAPTLLAGAAGLSLANGLTLTSSGIVDLNGKSLTLNGMLTGSGSFIVKDSGSDHTGKLTLTANNGGYTGVFNLAAGTLVANHPNAFGSGQLVMGPNSTLQSSSSLGGAIRSEIILSSGGNVNFDANGTSFSLTGNIGESAPSAVTIVNSSATPGMVTLSGTNRYSGGTTIASTTLGIGNGASLGSGAVIFNGTSSVLQAGIADLLLVNPLRFTSNGTIDLNGKAVTLAGPFSGAGALTITNSLSGSTGKLILPTSNSGFGSDIHLKNGLIVLRNGASLGTGAVFFEGATAILQAGAANLSMTNPLTFTSAGTIDLNGNALTLTGPFSGASPLTISDSAPSPASKMILANNSSGYTGDVLLAAGTLALRNGNALGSGVLTMNPNTTLQGDPGFSGTVGKNIALVSNSNVNFDANGASLALAGTISGNGAVTILNSSTAAGVVTLSGANGYTGGTTIASGTLSIASASQINGTGPGTVALTGGNLNVTGTVTATAPFAVMANGTITTAASQKLELQGVLTGAPGTTLTLNGSGIQSLHAVSVPAGSPFTISGLLSGTQNLTKLGTGTLILGGANQYTGGTTITAGTVVIGNGASLGTGTLTFNGTTPLLQSSTAGLTLANPLTFTTAGAFDLNGKMATLSGTFNGSGTFTVLNSLASSANKLILTADNSGYSGNILFTNGTLGISNPTALGTGTLVMSPATTLQAVPGLSGVIANGVALPSSGQVTLDANGTALSLAGNIVGGGNGSLTIVNSGPTAGVVMLSGTNSYTGGTTIASSGTLAISAASNLNGTGPGTVTLAGGTLSVTENGTGSVAITSPFAVTANATLTTAASQATVLQGILTGSAGTTLSLSGNGTNSLSSVFVNVGNPFTIAGTIGGNQTLNKLGAGTLVLTGANEYTGGTTISAGTLSIASPSNINRINPGTVTLAGGILNVTGNVTTAAPFAVTANAAITTAAAKTTQLRGILSGTPGVTLNLSGSGTTSLSSISVSNGTPFAIIGQIGGTQTLTKLGNGTLLLAGANGYTGGTTVQAGTLAIGHSASLGTGTLALNGTSPTLQIRTTGLSLANAFTLATSGTLDVQGNALTLAGSLIGTGALVIADSSASNKGTVIFSNNNRSYAGPIQVNNGVIGVVNTSNNLGSGIVTMASGTQLQAMGRQTAVANPFVFSSGVETIDTRANQLTLSGPLSGSGQLTIVDSTSGNRGVLAILSRNPNFSGAVQLQNGTLAIGNSTPLGTTGILAMRKNTALQGTADLTFPNDITLAAGTETISAAVGTTTTLTGNFKGPADLIIGSGVSSGTLNIQGAENRANTVTVSAGATLTGTGTLVADTKIKGTVIPGRNRSGVLTNYGPWTQASGSIYKSLIAPKPATSQTLATSEPPFTNQLRIVEGDFTIQPGATFEIGLEKTVYSLASYEVIQFNGVRHGSFSKIIQGSPFVAGTLSYEANRVMLNLRYIPLLSPSSWNAQQVADTLTQVFFSGNTAINKIFDDLLPLTLQQRDYALDQMHPATYKAMSLAQENNSVAVSSALNQRFQILLDLKHARPSRSNNVALVESVEPQSQPPLALKPNQALAQELAALLAQEQHTEASSLNQGVSQLEVESDRSIAMNGEAEPVLQEDPNREELTNTVCSDLPSTSEEPACEVYCQTNKKPLHVWVNPLGDFLNQSNVDFFGSPQVGYSASTVGFVGGADYNFCQYFYIGALGAFTDSDLTWNSNHGRAEIDSQYVGLYFSAVGQLFYGNLSVIGAWTDYDGRRNIIFSGVQETAKNSHDGKQILSHLDAGLNFNFRGLTIRPFDAFDFIAQNEQSFVEQNAGVYNLSVGKSHANLLRNELGVNLAASRCFTRHCFKELKATFDTKLSWVREMRTTGHGFSTTFVAVDAPFASIGYFPSRNLFAVGASVSTVGYRDMLTCTLYYNGVFGSKYADNQFGGQINFGF